MGTAEIACKKYSMAINIIKGKKEGKVRGKRKKEKVRGIA